MKLFIREFIGGYFLLLPTLVFTQTVETRDSIKTEIKQIDYDIQPMDRDIDIGGSRILQQQIDHPGNYATSLLFPRFSMPSFSILPKDSPLALFTLYNYSLKSHLEEIIQQGVYNRFVLNSFLTTDLNIFVAGYSNAFFQPYPYVNGSAKIDLILKLHDRIQFIGMGQISLREGIDPKLPYSPETTNYYGAGIQIKVNNKVGFGVGITNSYFPSNWTK